MDIEAGKCIPLTLFGVMIYTFKVTAQIPLSPEYITHQDTKKIKCITYLSLGE